MGTCLFLLLFILKCVSGKQAPSDPVCSGVQSDIVFLLDSSTSIGAKNFKKEVSFVSNFVKGFPVGPEAVQFSVVVFSTKVWNQFDLKAHHFQKDLLRALSNVKYRPGLTKTGTALKYIREHSYLPSKSGRQGNRKILIVVTDGISKNPAKTSTQSTLLHQDKVSVISVGVGNRVNLAELRNIASNKSFMFNVKDFDELNDISEDLQTKTCTEIAEAPSDPVCSGVQSDIVFLLDSSTSIGAKDFRKEVSFVSNFVKGFPVGPEAVQFSVVVFSTKVWNQFNLNWHHSKKDIIRALANVAYRPGSTMTGTALKFIRKQSYLSAEGGRLGIRKVLIVVTDGRSQNPTLTSEESAQLRKEGIFVITVGVGSRVKLGELRQMASNKGLVFNVKDFNGLTSILGDIQSTTCTEMADEEKCGLDALSTSASMTSSICPSPSFVRVNILNRVKRYCLGVLIGRDRVITTASCVRYARVYSVTLGVSGPLAQRVVVEVQSTILNPLYSEKGYDIAVLKLKKRVQYTECILPACLPTPRKQCEPHTITSCTIDRWTKEAKPSKVEIVSTLASLLSPELCSGVFKYGQNETIQEKTICIHHEDHESRNLFQGGRGMVSCSVNNTLHLYSLINSASMDSFPSLGVDLRDPDILEFINNN